MEHSVSILSAIGLSIIFASAAAHVARLLKQPLLLGYVVGGILLGTELGFGLVTDAASIELISEIGLILLLFIIGLEIDLRQLARMGKAMFTLGFAQFVLCVGLGFLCLPAFGYSWRAGNFDLLYLSVALALSSTLIVVKLLQDKFETATTAGRLTIGVLVLQDFWAILFMAFQPNLLNPRLGPILLSFGQGAVLVVFAFLASRHVLSRLFHAAGKTPELILLSALAWCFALCGLAEKAGLSKEMGALIAGTSIAAMPYSVDVISKLAGIRDFFVTLFFVALGLKVPKPTAAAFLMSGGLVAFVVASRLAAVVIPARAVGVSLRSGVVTAINLSQISEFSLVILALGAGYKHVGHDLQATVLTAMLLASLLSTYLIQFNDKLAWAAVKFLRGLGLSDVDQGAAAPPPDKTRDIVLLGCFREGTALLEMIESDAPELKERILVVDFNPALRRKLEERGFHWAYGDLSHTQTLHHLGIDHAKLVISTISDTFLKGTTNRRLLTHLKHLAPHARLIMTADDEAEAERLQHAGATFSVIPAELTAARMLELLGEKAPDAA
jgi:Kef-type K+ transport system membrane component KefB